MKPTKRRDHGDNTPGKHRKLAEPWRPGQSGNPGGRPKGSRNKLTTEFFEDFYAVWQQHGPNALKQVAEKSPRDFVRAAAMLMPKEFEIKAPLAELSDEELAELLHLVRQLNASCAGAEAGSGNGTPAKPH